MTLNDNLKISAEIVCSSAFLPRAARAVYNALERRNPEDAHLADMKEWSEAGGHFPVVWGSGFAVDVPYLLNQMVDGGDTDEQLVNMANSLLSPGGDINDLSRPEVQAWNNAWALAFQVSRDARSSG